MINIIRMHDGEIEQLQLADDEPLPPDAIWVDLVAPTEAVRQKAAETYGIALPDDEAIAEIEATSRFFTDADGVHIHAMFLHDFEETPVNVTVAFILRRGCLFTLRSQKLATFRLFRLAARRQPEIAGSSIAILLGLFENKIDHLADVLETAYTGLNDISSAVLGRDGIDMERHLGEIARHEDITGKARLSLLDAQRALTFIQRNSRLEQETTERSRELLRDIDSLLPHTAFLFDKVNFLMDAMHGFINIRQNQIIKIFSIAAVVFLPPTLVASIYGMNFHFIPELDWHFGYPLAILLMIASAITPLWYFKRRGWL